MNRVYSYLNQDYQSLREACLRENRLFRDECFPACEASLWLKSTRPSVQVHWRRPYEFLDSPKFIINESDPAELIQGHLGNCFFISAVTAISSVPEHFDKVVPRGQSFDPVNYAGIFHFRFWLYGSWVDVVVDDRLPVDSNNELVYCKNPKNPNELFGPLLEKAYAKLNRCYEFLNGGSLVNSLVDLSGGFNQKIKLKELFCDEEIVHGHRDEVVDMNSRKDYLWDIITNSLEMKSLTGTVVKRITDKNRQMIMENQLIIDHSYCIVEVFELVRSRDVYDMLITEQNKYTLNLTSCDTLRLLKLKNPWGDLGDQFKWNGEWSKYSKNWSKLSSELKHKLRVFEQSHGLFYLSLDEFTNYFDELYLVHTNLNAYCNNNLSMPSIKWNIKSFYGSWDMEKSTAGGCGNDSRKFYWTNPKYLIVVPEGQSDTPVAVSLTQMDQIRKRMESDGSYENSNEPIAFTIFKILDESLRPDEMSKHVNFDDTQVKKTASTGIYVYEREVNKVCSLSPGCYIVVPSTFERNVSMRFLVRIAHEEKHQLQMIDLNECDDQVIEEASYYRSKTIVTSDSDSSGISSMSSSPSLTNFSQSSLIVSSPDESSRAQVKSDLRRQQINGRRSATKNTKICTIL